MCHTNEEKRETREGLEQPKSGKQQNIWKKELQVFGNIGSEFHQRYQRKTKKRISQKNKKTSQNQSR